jgi:hypothetical protein
VLLQRSQTGEKIWVTPAGLARLIKAVTRIGKQIGLARLAKTIAWIDEHIGLAGLTRLARLGTWSRKQDVPVCLLTQKAGL